MDNNQPNGINLDPNLITNQGLPPQMPQGQPQYPPQAQYPGYPQYPPQAYYPQQSPAPQAPPSTPTTTPNPNSLSEKLLSGAIDIPKPVAGSSAPLPNQPSLMAAQEEKPAIQEVPEVTSQPAPIVPVQVPPAPLVVQSAPPTPEVPPAPPQITAAPLPVVEAKPVEEPKVDTQAPAPLIAPAVDAPQALPDLPPALVSDLVTKQAVQDAPDGAAPSQNQENVFTVDTSSPLYEDPDKVVLQKK